MDIMRYKLFFAADGEPVAYTDDIVTAVTIKRDVEARDGNKVAILDTDTDRVL